MPAVLPVSVRCESENGVVLRDPERSAPGFDLYNSTDRSDVYLIDAEGTEDWPPLDKAEVARRLATRIADTLGKGAGRKKK